MDSLPSTDPDSAHGREPAQAVLVGVTCSWGEAPNEPESVTAVIVHAARDMLVLEATDPARILPPMGTAMQVKGLTQQVDGRLAELGRKGRFLLSVGSRPVRRDLRIRVSLKGTLRSAALPAPLHVEIADLTSSGAKVRGADLPAGTQVSLDFIPPGRDELVTVRARVAYANPRAEQPWIGIVFRLVALRGGR
jgi:hypothetical protein